MSDQFSIYAHLTPTTHPDKICETVKLTVKARPDGDVEESKDQGDRLGDSISDIVTQLKEFLNSTRNDGNKIYEVMATSTQFMGTPLPLGLTASSVLANGSDLFVTVRVTIDTKKHVAPISSKPVASAQIEADHKEAPSAQVQAALAPSIDKILKFRTITKYSYFESGDKWIKVLLPDLAGLGSHPAEKVKIAFTSNRSFSVEVLDWKGQNWQFTVPKTQCRILPQACTFSHKSSALQISLRKKNTSDNWWSLFKSKAIGEKDTDEEDAESDKRQAEKLAQAAKEEQ